MSFTFTKNDHGLPFINIYFCFPNSINRNFKQLSFGFELIDSDSKVLIRDSFPKDGSTYISCDQNFLEATSTPIMTESTHYKIKAWCIEDNIKITGQHTFTTPSLSEDDAMLATYITNTPISKKANTTHVNWQKLYDSKNIKQYDI